MLNTKVYGSIVTISIFLCLEEGKEKKNQKNKKKKKKKKYNLINFPI